MSRSVRADMGRLVVRRPDGDHRFRRWPAITLYAQDVPRAAAWILRRRRYPPYRSYYWIERIGAPAFRPPTTKKPKEPV